MTKFCKDCKYSRMNNPPHDQELRCDSPKNVRIDRRINDDYLVTGGNKYIEYKSTIRRYCAELRQPHGSLFKAIFNITERCGLTGNWFEPKPPTKESPNVD